MVHCLGRFAFVFIILFSLVACDQSGIVSHLILKAPGDRYLGEIGKDVDFDALVEGFSKGITDENTGDFLATPFTYKRVKLSRSAVTMEIAVLEPRRFKFEMESSASMEIEKDKELRPVKVSFEWKSHFDCHNLFKMPELLERKGTVFLLHGYGAVKETLFPWAVFLSSKGYQTVLVDLRGHGRSGGKRVFFGTQESEDLSELLDELSAEMNLDERIGVFGFSYGAGIGIKWAASDSRIQTVVAVSPYGSPRKAIPQLVKLFGLNIDSSVVERSLQRLEDRKKIIWKDCEIYQDVEKQRSPILLVRGESDSISTTAVISGLYERAPEGSIELEIPYAQHADVIGFYSDLKGPVAEHFQTHLLSPLHAAR